MLVLTRGSKEEVVLTVAGITILVQVLEFRTGQRGGQRVRLGFTAPEEVIINRREVIQQRQQPHVVPELGDKATHQPSSETP